jgi:DNA-binding CsgD family transcriptional regulator
MRANVSRGALVGSVSRVDRGTDDTSCKLAAPAATSDETAATVEALGFAAEALASSLTVSRRQLKRLLGSVQQAVTAAELVHGIGENLIDAAATIAAPVDVADDVGILALASHRKKALDPEGTVKARRPVSCEEKPASFKTVGRVLGGGGSVPRTELRHQRSAGAIGYAGSDQGPCDFLVSAPSKAPITKLTPRQRDVLYVLSRGKSNREIALELDLAESTVRTHVTAILKTLGVRNRTQAVLAAGVAANPMDG